MDAKHEKDSHSSVLRVMVPKNTKSLDKHEILNEEQSELLSDLPYPSSPQPTLLHPNILPTHPTPSSSSRCQMIILSFLLALILICLVFSPFMLNNWSDSRIIAEIRSHQMPIYWRLTEQQIRDQENDNRIGSKVIGNQVGGKAIQKGNNINHVQDKAKYKNQTKPPIPIQPLKYPAFPSTTRQQLGRTTWPLLHLMTSQFPQNLDQSLITTFNLFLSLFARFYPCKLCGNHFLTLLKKKGQFNGQKRIDAMIYVCQLHNDVNKSLGKEIYNCGEMMMEWGEGSCGCKEEQEGEANQTISLVRRQQGNQQHTHH